MHTTDADARPARHRGGRVPLLATALALAVAGWWIGRSDLASPPADAVAYELPVSEPQPVVSADLDVLLRLSGELQPVRAIDVANPVPNPVLGRRTIVALIAEGTAVAAGDVIALLDGEDLREDVAKLTQEVSAAEAAHAQAREQLDSQTASNADEEEGARVGLALAELDLRRYEQATWPQLLADAHTRLDTVRQRHADEREQLQNNLSLLARGFVTAQKVKEHRLAVRRAENDVLRAENDLTVLSEYQHPIDLKSRQDRVRQAHVRLDRVRQQGRGAVANREAAVRRTGENHANLMTRLDLRRDQLAACEVSTPEAGVVARAPTRASGGEVPGTLAEGDQVQYRQTLVTVADTSVLKAVVHAGESQVALVRQGQRVGVRLPDGGEVEGEVVSIGVAPRPGDGERVYPVEIRLTSRPDAPPGTPVWASVRGKRLENVTAVPPDRIVTAGGRHFVFVWHGHATPASWREVFLGITGTDANGSPLTHVVDGVSAGEKIVSRQDRPPSTLDATPVAGSVP